MNNQQEEFLRDFDFIRESLMLKPIHSELLNKIDPDNKSKAARIVFDSYLRNTKMNKMKDYLLIVLVCLIFILGVYQIIVL